MRARVCHEHRPTYPAHSVLTITMPVPGLTKSSALRGGHRDVNADERVVVGQDLVAASVAQTLRVAYPDLFVLHDPSGEAGLSFLDPALHNGRRWHQCLR